METVQDQTQEIDPNAAQWQKRGEPLGTPDYSESSFGSNGNNGLEIAPEDVDGQERIRFSAEQINPELKAKLDEAGINVETVDFLSKLAMYDHDNKSIIVRQDADADFVNDYIKNTVFIKQDEIGEPNPEPITEDLNFNYDENEGEQEDGPQQPEQHFEPKPELKSESEEEKAERLRREYVPEWRQSEEWKKFEAMRDEAAQGEVLVNYTGIASVGVEVDKSEYAAYKKEIAKKIEEEMKRNFGEIKTPEQEAEISKIIHDKINEELLEKEHESYKKALENHRMETLKDKGLEAMGRIAKTKAVQWYLSLPKKQRIALNFALGTTAGIAFGAASAIGVAGYTVLRGGRIAASLAGAGLGTAIAEKKKSWSLEDLDKKEQAETDAIKNSDMPWEEKSKKFEEVKNKYDKERKSIKRKKMALTVGLGAGGGFLAGAMEHFGTGATHPAESGGRGNALANSRVPRGSNFKPPVQDPNQLKTAAVSSAGQDASPQTITVNEKMPHVEPIKSEISKTLSMENRPAEKLFDNPAVLKHSPVAGDSTWKDLNKVLEQNSKFRNFSGTAEEAAAKKSFAVSGFLNEAMKNPSNYGLGKNGEMIIGKEVNFEDLFKNSAKVNQILDKAEHLSGDKIHNIIDNNAKITEWVKGHPHDSLDEGKVDEILNAKPSAAATVDETAAKVEPEPEPVPMVDHLETDHSSTVAGEEFLETRSGNSFVDSQPNAAAHPDYNTEQMMADLQRDRARLAELEQQAPLRNPNLERTFYSDAKMMQEIDKAFASDIDHVYGRHGIFSKVAGVDSDEWKEMARLPARKVVEYYTGDSAKSGLAPEIVKNLEKSPKHAAFKKEVFDELFKRSKGEIKPYENENMEQYIKKLGAYVMKSHLNQMPKAA